MIETKQFLEILKKHQEGKASKEEEEFLRTYYNLFDLEPDVLNTMPPEQQVELKNRMENYLLREINQQKAGIGKKVKLWPFITAAAAVLLVVASAGILFFSKTGTDRTRAFAKNDVKPGGNKAYLTLSNGQTVSLDDAAEGVLAEETGVEITKTDDGQVIYSSQGTPQQNEAENTIETPRGGQYQLVLPDGSKVWLNAASSLRYPVALTARSKREVELTGEAYFEIAKDKNHPFIVKSAGQEVEVLGTHFNISTYADEPAIKTTLLEGSIRIDLTRQTPAPVAASPTAPSGKHPATSPSTNRPATSPPAMGHPATSPPAMERPATSPPAMEHPSTSPPAMGRPATSPPYFKEGWSKTGVVLKPNQQSSLSNGKIKLTEIDPDEVMAWKNGYFSFKEEKLQTIMQKIARWYDIEVTYNTPALQQKIFGAYISRNKNISEVLKMLERTGEVKFKIEGRKINVTK